MSNQTRLERNFIAKLDDPRTHFAMAVGHGAHEEGNARVPKNMYVIFMTRAGYWGSVPNSSCPIFTRTFSNRNSIIKFLKGQTTNLPSLVTTKGWDWKNHIYPPNAVMQNFSLEMKQDNIHNNKGSDIRNIFTKFRSMTGVHINKGNRWGYGTTKYIGEIMNHVSTSVPDGHMVVLFINGCRSTRNVTTKMTQKLSEVVPTPSTLKRYGYYGTYTTRIHTPQIYKVPMTNISIRARNLNQIASGYMRKRNSSRVNGPPLKITRGASPRKRTVNNTNKGVSSSNAMNTNNRVVRRVVRRAIRPVTQKKRKTPALIKSFTDILRGGIRKK
jgi:hypothetical protein